MVAKQPNPTPQEIAELCDKIQEQWSEKDRTRRRVVAKRRWLPPVVITDVDLSQEVTEPS